jgi:hypothetical protein
MWYKLVTDAAAVIIGIGLFWWVVDQIARVLS